MKDKTQQTKEILAQLDAEIENHELPKDYPMTNFKAYKRMVEIYTDYEDIDFDLIDEVFDIENRTKVELQNLKEFIICVTLLCANDVLKAQVSGDKKHEKREAARYKKRCKLMTALLDAINSHRCTLD